MKRMSFSIILGAVLVFAAVPAGAQEEAAARGAVEAFQSAVKAGNLAAARALISPELLKLIDSGATEAQEGAFLHQDALNFLRGELSGNAYRECEIAGATVQGERATVDLKPAEGGLILLHLAKSGGEWLLSPAPSDPLQKFEAEGEAVINKDQTEMKDWVKQEGIDQDIADDINEDRDFRRR